MTTIVHTYNNCISVFTPEGQFVTSCGASDPYGLAVDNIGIVDEDDHNQKV